MWKWEKLYGMTTELGTKTLGFILSLISYMIFSKSPKLLEAPLLHLLGGNNSSAFSQGCWDSPTKRGTDSASPCPPVKVYWQLLSFGNKSCRFQRREAVIGFCRGFEFETWSWELAFHPRKWVLFQQDRMHSSSFRHHNLSSLQLSHPWTKTFVCCIFQILLRLMIWIHFFHSLIQIG